MILGLVVFSHFIHFFSQEKRGVFDKKRYRTKAIHQRCKQILPRLDSAVYEDFFLGWLWNDIVQHKITQNPSAEAVLVLPKNYGYSMRYPEDKIWGFWGPDESTSVIWDKVQTLKVKVASMKLLITYLSPAHNSVLCYFRRLTSRQATLESTVKKQKTAKKQNTAHPSLT